MACDVRLLKVSVQSLRVSMMKDLAPLRDRLYESYVSQHSGWAPDDAVRLIYQRDIRSALPPSSAGPVVDIGRGCGHLVRCLLAGGTTRRASTSAPSRSPWLTRPGCSRSSRATTLACCSSDRAGWPRSRPPTCWSTSPSRKCSAPLTRWLRPCGRVAGSSPGCRTPSARSGEISGTAISRTSPGSPRGASVSWRRPVSARWRSPAVRRPSTGSAARSVPGSGSRSADCSNWRSRPRRVRSAGIS